jgi:hypothetical protein
MSSSRQRVLQWLLVGGLVLGLVGLGAWRLDRTSGQGPTLSLVGAPGSVSAGDSAFTVEVRIAGVTDLGTYEWQLSYDPAIVELTDPPASAVTNGGFLGSTGRSVSCQGPLLPPSAGLEAGEVRFGCNSQGSAGGPNGSGLLSTVKFRPLAGGAPNIGFVCGGLGDAADGDTIPIGNVEECGATITPTPDPNATPPLLLTLTPGPTSTPTGPVPTPTPLPAGYEAIPLFGSCQFEAWTGAEGTVPQELSELVGPEGNLRALWAMQPPPQGRGFSPEFPEVSDMEPVGLLDILAICTSGPGNYVRPIV